MVKSIKQFLLIYLLLSLTITSSLSIVGTYFLNIQTVRTREDKKLYQFSYFLRALLSSHGDTQYISTLKRDLDKIDDLDQTYRKSTQFIVWDSHGKKLLESPKAPNIQSPLPFNTKPQRKCIDHECWRILSTKASTKLHKVINITVIDSTAARKEMINQLTWSSLIMLLWSYPLFGLLIWFSIDRGLFSLKKLTRSISDRKPSDLKVIDLNNVPIEVVPIVESLNRLFDKVRLSFERNKQFSSDAAHELRTPLAALRTQTQVALRAESPEHTSKALNNILLSVDRCTHLVQQLLILSRLDPESTLPDISQFNLTQVATEVIAQLVPQALHKNIEVALHNNDPKNVIMTGNEVMIAVLIRNLVDNAIRYTPENGEVNIHLNQSRRHIEIRVIDTGIGIPEKLKKRVFERFFRVLGTKTSGSGLGLSIVRHIVKLHHGHINLLTPKNGIGLEIFIKFPKNSFN